MPKNAKVVAHVEKGVHDALEALARGDGRSLSTYVERLLIAHLGKRETAKAKPKTRPGGAGKAG